MDEDKDIYETKLDETLLVAGEMSSGEILEYMMQVSEIPKEQIIVLIRLVKMHTPVLQIVEL